MQSKKSFLYFEAQCFVDFISLPPPSYLGRKGQ
jgi:hypothetical protein